MSDRTAQSTTGEAVFQAPVGAMSLKRRKNPRHRPFSVLFLGGGQLILPDTGGGVVGCCVGIGILHGCRNVVVIHSFRKGRTRRLKLFGIFLSKWGFHTINLKITGDRQWLHLLLKKHWRGALAHSREIGSLIHFDLQLNIVPERSGHLIQENDIRDIRSPIQTGGRWIQDCLVDGQAK